MWWSHWASMLRWFWPILSVIWLGTPRNGPEKVTCLLLEHRPETNSQNTTHIDSKAGTGGVLHVLKHIMNIHQVGWFLTTWSCDIWKGGETQAPACSVSGKGSSLCLYNLSGVLTKPAKYRQSAEPITSLFPKHVSFSWLTATRYQKFSGSLA